MLQDVFTKSSSNEPISQWRKEIILGLERAKSKALPMDEYQALKRKQGKLLSSIKKDGKPEDVGLLLDLEDILDGFRLHFYTLPELRLALEEAKCPPADIPKILAYQNSCAGAADEVQAARIIYMLELSKSASGHPQPYAVHTSVRVFHRDDWFAEEIQYAESRIQNAPKRQGLNFSKGLMREMNMLHPLSFSF